MSGVKTPTEDGGKGKKGKKKKKKLTKSEKAHEKLEKAILKLKEDEAYFDNFIDRMHCWLVDVAPVAAELYSKMDTDGEGAVTTDEFKAGLFDLNVPLTAVETHLLTRLLDPDDAGEVDYTQLSHGLQLARETFNMDRDMEFESLVLETTRRKFPACPCCKMSIVEPFVEQYPRFISLELRMVTFDSFKDYPGHLDLLVHAHLPVCRLIQMIIEETQITSSKIAIFRDRTRSRESLLPPKSTLQECGFLGDSRNDPEEVLLYYDYTVEFTDCPILLCDHYFGQKLQV
ncbi:microtubule-actin cross-linking factor 1, isoforms 6/7-like isoform X2 [Babylonia areolata]